MRRLILLRILSFLMITILGLGAVLGRPGIELTKGSFAYGVNIALLVAFVPVALALWITALVSAWNDPRLSRRKRAAIFISLLIGNFPGAIVYYVFAERRGAAEFTNQQE